MDTKEERRKSSDYSKSFSEQVDAALSNKLPIYAAIKVCDTPEILQKAGLEALPMLYTQAHLRRAVHAKDPDNDSYHGLSVEFIKELPYHIENPAMIFDSPKDDKSVVCLFNVVDDEKLPVIMSIRANGKGAYELEEVETNFITSVYGKRNFGRYFENVVNHNELIFVDKEKSQSLERTSQLQLLRYCPSTGFDSIIKPARCAVNRERGIKLEKIRQLAEVHRLENADRNQEPQSSPLVINIFSESDSIRKNAAVQLMAELEKSGKDVERVTLPNITEALDVAVSLKEKMLHLDERKKHVDFLVFDNPLFAEISKQHDAKPEEQKRFAKILKTLSNQYQNFNILVESDKMDSKTLERQNALKDTMRSVNYYFGEYQDSEMSDVSRNAITYREHLIDREQQKSYQIKAEMLEYTNMDEKIQDIKSGIFAKVNMPEEKMKLLLRGGEYESEPLTFDIYINLLPDNKTKLWLIKPVESEKETAVIGTFSKEEAVSDEVKQMMHEIEKVGKGATFTLCHSIKDELIPVKEEGQKPIWELVGKYITSTDGNLKIAMDYVTEKDHKIIPVLSKPDNHIDAKEIQQILPDFHEHQDLRAYLAYLANTLAANVNDPYNLLGRQEDKVIPQEKELKRQYITAAYEPDPDLVTTTAQLNKEMGFGCSISDIRLISKGEIPDGSKLNRMPEKAPGLARQITKELDKQDIAISETMSLHRETEREDIRGIEPMDD